jgi:hypothetical protein
MASTQRAERRAMAKQNTDQREPEGFSHRLRGLLAHPLTLLIVGALLSSLLIPSWTKQWQDRQSELQVKVDLVDRIDNSVTGMIMSVQFAVVGAEGQSQADYDRAYRQWELDRRLIGSQLRAYYPEESLARDWEELAAGITDLYVGSQEGSSLSGSSKEEYLTEFEKRKEALFERTDELNNKILETRISVFH